MDLDRARERLRTIQTSARAAELSRDAVAKQGRAEMMILEPAYLPSRPDRGRGRVFFAGAAMTLFFALGYAAARVLLDDALLDEGDVAALGGPQVIVAMPHLPAPAAPPPERAIVPAAPPDDEDDGEAPPSSAAPASAPPGPGLVPSERGLVVHPSRGRSYPISVVFDDPEVEILGADVSPDAVARAAASPPEAVAALRVLRHRLEQKRGDGSFVVSVMSPGPAEGKTSLALRLAVTLSEAERARVVLVEGNFERPRLATTLGLCLPARAGFSAQLYERMSGHGMAWGVVRLLPSLSLLAEPGRHAAHPHAIHSTHFEAAIAALRRSYEYVVIDGPGVAGSGDANVIEAASDAVLLAVRAGRTKGAALSRATRQLGERRVLGVVLNDVDAPNLARAI
jgi:Mrp family chromosome partitioning ATPase